MKDLTIDFKALYNVYVVAAFLSRVISILPWILGTVKTHV